MATNNLKTPFFLDRKNEARELFALTDAKAAQPITIGYTEFPVGTTLSTILATADQRPYKVYSALIAQTSTDAPVATVLENTLGFTPVWSLNATGVFRATSANNFPLAATQVFVSAGGANDKVAIAGAHTNDDYVDILHFTASTGAAVNVTSTTSVEIRIYQ